MASEETQTITAQDVGTLVIEPVPGDLTPEQADYVRAKAARMTDVATVQDFRDKETKLPFVEGGRPTALKIFDARIAELNAQPKQEG
jgi:multidrug efflux pump subunit AcrB